MIGFLIFYCCFSSLFCMGTVDETDYKTRAGAIMSAIFSFFMGSIMFPVILGVFVNKRIKGLI